MLSKEAVVIQEARESVTVGWVEYIAARKPHWSESNYHCNSKSKRNGQRGIGS